MRAALHDPDPDPVPDPDPDAVRKPQITQMDADRIRNYEFGIRNCHPPARLNHQDTKTPRHQGTKDYSS
jgi:hypothetical protein